MVFIKKKKQIVLTIFSSVIIILFFLLPANRTWLTDRIIPYFQDFQKQKNDLGIERRKTKRYQSAYTQAKLIKQFFEKKGIAQTALVLIPPTSYFKKLGT